MALTVIVVDPQYGWAKREDVRDTFGRIAATLSERNLWSKTILTVFQNGQGSPFRRRLGWWTGFREKDAQELLPEFAHRGVPVFGRQTYGLSEPLWRYCREILQASEILLTGVETDATLLHAAMEGFDRGYGMFVVPSLVASTYGEPGQNAGLAVLAKVLGRDHVITDVRDILRLHDSGGM